MIVFKTDGGGGEETHNPASGLTADSHVKRLYQSPMLQSSRFPPLLHANGEPFEEVLQREKKPKTNLPKKPQKLQSAQSSQKLIKLNLEDFQNDLDLCQ